MLKRCISLLLLLAMVAGMLPAISITEVAAADSTQSVSTESEIYASPETVASLFNVRSKDVHPRIMANSDDFNRIRRLIKTNPYMEVWYTRLYDYCVSQLNEPVSEYELTGGYNMLEVSKTASKRILFLSMAYQLSAEQRFAQRAVDEMLAVCAFSDWHPDHYLDTAQMAYGVGIGYDWLYYYMTDAQRSTVRTALYNYAIKTSLAGQSYQTNTSNWNPWCHGGVTVAACAIYESYPTDCANYLSSVVTNIQCALNVLTPSGAYPEGPTYYAVGTEFSVITFDTMQSVLGTDFGLSDIDGFRDCGSYLLAMNGNVHTFNFGDADSTIADFATLHWFASRYHQPELSVYQEKGAQNSEALALLWYDPELTEGYFDEEPQPDRLLYSNEYESVASFRSNNAAGIYAAIKSGNNQSNHSDLDAGTFVLEALGQVWMEDLGADDYNLSGYWEMHKTANRWKYYRKRAEGQNVMVINPDTYGGQDHDAKCQIINYESGYDGGYATVDLTDAYNGYGASSVKRGLLLFDNRSRVLLRDEITCSNSSNGYWFAHTKADITLSSDRKTAELKLNGKTLLAQIASPSNARFSVMDAEPLSTSPNPSGQNSRDGYRKLAIDITGMTSLSIAVVFTPVLQESDRTKALPTAAIEDFSSLITPYDLEATLQKNASGVYEIRTAEELGKFAAMVNSGTTFNGQTVKLMSDLDLKGRTIQPIGDFDADHSFQGTFDGGNHVIRNLFIYEPNSRNMGLFGFARWATIKNLGIESGTVFCKDYSGALVGCGTSVTIDNCFNRAKIVGSDGFTGGLVGQLGATSTVKNSYNNGIGMDGGIVGYLNSESITTISNCYHRGQCAMIGFYNTEGIYMIQKVTVDHCYSTDLIKGADVISNSSKESYTNCETLSDSRLIGSAVTLGSAFISDCEWENDGFPVLKWQCDTVLPSDLRLSTVPELRLLSYQVNSGATDFSGKTITLAEDIDLDSREWIPIGGNTTDGNDTGPIFRGTFDGQGHAIRNLRISTGNSYVGFFGSVHGNIRNFGIQSGSVKGADKVAGVVAYLHGATMEQCYNRAVITGTGIVAGVVGMSGRTQIRNCYNNASITSSSTAGGIVGYYSSGSANSVMENCYHNGSLSGTLTGGICASINGSITNNIFTNCYTTDGAAIIGSASSTTQTNCQTLTSATLKASDDIPGTQFHRDFTIPQNGGYPILNAFVYGSDNLSNLTPVNNVYNISTEQDLRKLAYMVNEGKNTFSGKTIKLLADIDLNYKEWAPIGGNVPVESAPYTRFQGTFDGGGHTISGLSITTGNSFVGLFGFLYSNGSVSNVGIESGVIFGGAKAAGIAGCILSGATVNQCYNKANVSGTDAVGGISGMFNNSGSKVQNCYNTGSVSSKGSAGGIVGFFAGGAKSSQILNCYNTGVGSNGIVGVVNASASGNTMQNCYTINSVPLVGTQSSLSIQTSAQKTLAELRGMVSTLGESYKEDYFVKNEMLPVLAWENGSYSTTLQQVNGVYQINTVQDLRLLSYMVRKGTTFYGKSIVLNADLDLENKDFLPIGGSGESETFQGTFDGRGYVIRNLRAVQWEYGEAGLFGRVKGAKIKNLGVESGFVLAKNNSGGIAGFIYSSSSISSCYNKAFVYADTNAGGITGVVSAGNCKVENCYNTGRVCERSATSATGGLIGFLTSSANNFTIENSYNVGNRYGIINSLHPNATNNNNIKNCYSAGTYDLLREYGSVVLTGAAQISHATMKTYAPVLGDAFDDDKKSVNRGYPVLAWQSGKLCFHEYTQSVVIAPTCTAQGYTTHTCSRCGDSYKDTYTTALGHNYTNYTVTKTPTTSATGTLTGTCSRCSATDVLTLPKLTAADYTITTTTPATCTTSGVDKYTWKVTTYGSFSFDVTTSATGHSYTTKVTAPTCTAQGYTTHTCSKCNDSYKDTYIDATGHSWNSGSVTTDPTCTAAGEKTFTCTVCKATKKENVAALGHDLTGWTNYGNADNHRKTCKRSGCSYSETQAHSWDSGVINPQPTCTATGTKTYTCSVCNQKKTETVGMLSHTYANYKATTNPTTSATGVLTGYCSCGKTTTVTLPKLTANDYTITTTTPATCTATGIDKYTWKTTTYGTFSFNVTTSALQHSYKSVVTAPTCTDKGYTTHTCQRSGCGHSYVDTYVDALGHNYSYKATKNPSLTATGTLTGTCSRNSSHTTTVELPKLDTTNYTKTTTTPATCTATGIDKYTWKTTTYGTFSFNVTTSALQHSYKSVVTAPTCTDKGYTTHTCQRSGCGHSYVDTYVDALGHNYSYKATKNPSLTATGTLTGTCSRNSSHTTTVELPKLDTTNYTKTTTTPATCTATGIDKYTWKTTTYGTFSFNVTTSALQHSYKSVVTAPTCTAQGYTTHTCQRSGCGYSYKDTYTAMLAHSYTVKKNTVAPNCKTWTQGYTVYQCSGCTATEKRDYVDPKHTEVIDEAVAATCTEPGLTKGSHCSVCNTVLVAQNTVAAQGHDYRATVIKPTCTAQGYTTYTCSRCSDTYKDDYVAAGHTYGSATVVEPTCTEKGYTYKTCSVCKYVYKYSYVDAKGHTYNNGEITTQPTCMTQGVKTYTCTRSGCTSAQSGHTKTETIAIDSTAHKWDSGTVTTQPGCTSTGIKTYKCEHNNEHTKTETVSATGHKPVYQKKVDATCTENGMAAHYKCSVCSKLFTDSAGQNQKEASYFVITAPGHSYDAVVTAPTCTAKGYTTYTCSACGHSYVGDEKAALNHDYVATVTAPTCEAQGYTTHDCSRCDASYVDSYKDALGHNYIGVVTKEPTCTAEGIKTFTCQNDSSHTYTESIAKLLHTDSNGDGKCDGCGCDTNAEAQDIALSYARTVEINLLNKLTITDVSAELMSDLELLELTYADESDESLGKATLVDTDGDGKAESLRFVPENIISNVIHLNCKVKITAEDGAEYFRAVPVNVVPATIMYYETDFAYDVFETKSDCVLLDFDSADSSEWEAIWSSSVTTDKTAGVLSGNITGKDPHIGMSTNGNHFNYVLKENDVVIVRIKVDAGTGTGLQAFLGVEGESGYSEPYAADASSFVPNGEYQSVVLKPRYSAVGKMIWRIRIDPIWTYIKDGNFEIDYVYIGAPENAPEATVSDSDFLYFDFKNSELDKKRYENPVYGGFNFDVSNWATSVSTSNNAYRLNHAEGTVSIPVVSGSDSASNYGPYFGTTKTSGSYPWGGYPELAPLSYPLSEDTVVKVRFKLNGCTQVSTPVLYLLMHYVDAAGTKGFVDKIYQTYTCLENEYQTCTFKLSDYNFVGTEMMKTVEFRFKNIRSVSGGAVTIDYIYVGSEANFDAVRAKYNQAWQTINDGTNAANDDKKTEQAEIVYGYDSAYENDTKLSNGGSLYVEGTGVAKMAKDSNGNIVIDYANSTTYTEASFTFTGTG
ncbi:MAG: hypothetical protein E7434_03115, partial [Ruminococcaceae bacterium]|nr:hypothetical protein [Oscillospiraceae bacterium]